MSETPDNWETATRLVRGGLARSGHGETAEALFLTQSFVYDSAESADARFKGEEAGFIYARYGSPTVRMFEERLALLEGAQACRATASGMAAVHLALTGLLRAGDHVVAGRALFGSCAWILNTWGPRFGIEATLVDGPDLEAWRAAVRPNTKVFFLESPANPLLEICDIASAISDIAREAGARVVVDKCLRHADLPVAAQAGRGRRGLFGDQAPSTAGEVLGSALLGDPDSRRRKLPRLRRPAHGTGAVAIRRHPAPAQGAGDTRPSRAPPDDRDRRASSPT